MKALIAACAVTVAMVVSLTGCYPKTPEERAEKMVSHLASKLDLDSAQKAKLELVKKSYLESRARSAAQREQLKQEMNALILSERFQQSQLEGLMERQRAANKERLAATAPAIVDFHASLKPEQKQKFVKMLEDFGMY